MLPHSWPPGPWRADGLFRLVSIGCFSLLVGCASPGAPRPPSLQLPGPVPDLTVTRAGDLVELHFTAPSRTTDDLPLHSSSLRGDLCRQLTPRGPCAPVDPLEVTSTTPGASLTVVTGSTVTWTDYLPAPLREGPARAIMYRVALRNEDGRSAGFSEPALVAAGGAPPRVEGLAAQGTRNGVLLQWAPVPGGGEVLLDRQQLSPAAAAAPAAKQRLLFDSGRVPSKGGRPARRPAETRQEPGTQWLQAEPGNASAANTLDGNVAEGVLYRYVAVRRVVFQSGEHSLELRSAPSASAELAWHDVFPPPPPQKVTAIGFTSPGGASATSAPYAVDLVWDPVADARLTGYIVRRLAVDADERILGAPEILTDVPLVIPAFHDATALSSATYRYEVTAVDARGNSSAPAIAFVKAQPR